MTLLKRIEQHLKRTGTPPARFGRDAARDPRLVFDMRAGRVPRSTLAVRITAYMDGQES